MRLTTSWMPNIEDALGETGKKGRQGEIHEYEEYRNLGFIVEDYYDDFGYQVSGCDLIISTEDLTCSAQVDIKHNLTVEDTFFVELDMHGWLYNPRKTSKIIIHTNAHTNHRYGYLRKAMVEYLKFNNVRRVQTPSGVLGVFNKFVIDSCTFIHKLY